MSLKSTARAYLRDAAAAFQNAPVEVGLAVLAAALFSYSLEENVRFNIWWHIAIGIFIAFAGAWCATLLRAMNALDDRRRWVLTGVGALGAALYLLLVKTPEVESEGWRALMLFAAVVLLVFAAPAWVRSDASASLRLRRINGRFMLRAMGIGLYGVALFGGLALALTAIQKLFELKLEDEIYGHTFGWIMLVLVPWVIVGGLHSYVRPLDEESDVARVVQRLTSFLVPPLLVLYYAILYVYALRIAITGELPKNLVSPMVLAAGLLTALAIVLFDPSADDTRAGQRALRLAPVFFLPLVPLGVWALAARINEYGWTEFRLLRVVLLVLLFVLAVLATWQLIRRRPFSLRVAPVLLGVPVLLAAIGPWSVLATARRSQQARLAEALRAAQVNPRVPVGNDTARRPVSRELFERINNIGFYLQGHFGDSAVAEVTGSAPTASPWAGLAEVLKLTAALDDTLPWVTHGALQPGTRVPVAGGVLYRIAGPSSQVRVDGPNLLISVAGQTLTANLDSMIQQLPRVQRREQRNLPSQSTSVWDQNRNLRGQLVLLEATVQRWADSVRIMTVNGVLILRDQ